jgi:hypothetical protein
LMGYSYTRPLFFDYGMQYVGISIICYSVAMQGGDAWFLTGISIINSLYGIVMLFIQGVSDGYDHCGHIGFSYLLFCILGNVFFTHEIFYLCMCAVWFLIGCCAFFLMRDTVWWAHGFMHICSGLVAWYLVRL